ncbi:MAG: RNA polymerase sigma factor [Gemmatimonadetes bacterium]|nr:RNA polymerase sigma factor [Gemmatimonadota bacterium]
MSNTLEECLNAPGIVLSDGDADRRDVRAVSANGDEAAFRSLYRRHTPALYAFACRMMGGESPDVDDVVQDAWLRAVRAIGEFGWRSSLRTWLSSIVLNCCRERWREKIQPSSDGLDSAAPTADLNLRLDLEAAVAALPPGYRAVLILHDVEGYTHDEIAERLGMQPGTSKSQLFHARRALRNRLSGDAPSATAST